MSEPGFWDDQEHAQKTSTEHARVSRRAEMFDRISHEYEDAAGLYFDALPRCHCGGLLRPHVVWFGEIPLGMREIGEALDDCDLFLTVGSSGAVHPAAGFVSHLRNVKNRHGRFARCIYVGLERPDNAHSFDECRLGKAGDLLPSLFDGPSFVGAEGSD